MSWNIAGWWNKAKDYDFIEYLKTFDIVLLQETWALTPIFLEGFKSYSLPASRVNGRGCLMAGLTTFISLDLSLHSHSLQDNNSTTQAILLNCGKFTLIILNVYIPPSSDRLTLTTHWNNLATYLEQLEQKIPNAEIILAGDFNARVGNDIPSLFSSSGVDQDDLLHLFSPSQRKSKDTYLNPAGLNLFRFCIQFCKIWLNGLINFNNSYEFTFISPKGCSVIDYILISPSFWTYVSDFSVGVQTSSDHLPLIFAFHTTEYFKPALSQDAEFLPKIYRTPDLSQRIVHLLKSNTNIDLKSQLLNSTNSNETILTYESLLASITNSLKQESRLAITKKVKHSQNALWFDKECRKLKTQIRTLYYNFHNSAAT